MSKANENAARSSAKDLMTQAPKELGPIANQAGSDSAASRLAADQSLKGAGDTFSGMAQTGGFTPEQSSNYINRATEASTAAGNVMSNEAKLAAARTGQGNPQAAISRIARQMGQNASSAAVNAEAGLNEQKNANRLAGAGGQLNVGSAQAGMANQSAQQRLQALGLQFNTEVEAQQFLDQMSHNPGILDNIMSVGGLATGAIKSLYGNNGVPALRR